MHHFQKIGVAEAARDCVETGDEEDGLDAPPLTPFSHVGKYPRFLCYPRDLLLKLSFDLLRALRVLNGSCLSCADLTAWHQDLTGPLNGQTRHFVQ